MATKQCGTLSRRAGVSRLEVLLTLLLLAVLAASAYLVLRGSRAADHAEIAAAAATPEPAAPETANAEEATPAEDEPAPGARPAAREWAMRRDEGDDASPGFEELSLRIPRPGEEADGARDPRRDAAEARRAEEEAAAKARKPKQLPGVNEIELQLERIAQMPWSPEAERLLNETLEQWTLIDPVGALDYALSLDGRRSRNAAVNAILGEWAKQDPRAAYEWFLANSASDPRSMETSVKAIFLQMLNRSPDWAMQSALGLSDQNLRRSAVRALVDQLVKSGDDARVRRYYDTLGTASDKSLFASTLAQSWAIYQPYEAAAWASGLTDAPARQRAVSSVISTWGYDDPESAAEWVRQLPADDFQRIQLQRVTQVWAREDPVGAANWLLSQFPPSAQLDPAVYGLVTTVMRSNPEGAMSWASTITNPDQRASAVQMVARSWMRRDPERATAFVNSTPLLADDARQRILRGGGRGWR